jgi:ribosome-associated heat shock protein Hsp15
MADTDRQRIDKWLWFARVVKTRTLAQKLVTSGSVRVNREKQDGASRPVKLGDTLTFALRSGVRVLRVLATGRRRGPPTEARQLFEDLTPPPAASAPADRPDGGSRRPTKRDRRLITAFRRLREDDFSGSAD